eukprot:4110405-Lingulodinium_polyedra.AAC.1
MLLACERREVHQLAREPQRVEQGLAMDNLGSCELPVVGDALDPSWVPSHLGGQDLAELRQLRGNQGSLVALAGQIIHIISSASAHARDGAYQCDESLSNSQHCLRERPQAFWPFVHGRKAPRHEATEERQAIGNAILMVQQPQERV